MLVRLCNLVHDILRMYLKTVLNIRLDYEYRPKHILNIFNILHYVTQNFRKNNNFLNVKKFIKLFIYKNFVGASLI